MRSEATKAYWDNFCRHTGVLETQYDVIAFGDSPAMADELCALVLSGKKRATAGLLLSFTDSPVPAAGDYVMVVNGTGQPMCIYRSTEVRIGPLNSVDERFAWDEGEGERTRDWWLAAHREFFKREAAQGGFTLHDEIETVFERFALVWPPDQSSR